MTWVWIGLGLFALLVVALVVRARSQRVRVIYRIEEYEATGSDLDTHYTTEFWGYAANRGAAYALGAKVQRLQHAFRSGIEGEVRTSTSNETRTSAQVKMTEPPD